MSRPGAFLDQRGPALARGLEHGRLLAGEIRALVKDVCPPSWRDDPAVGRRLERELEALSRYGGAHHVEELAGIAAGSGIPFEDVARLNLVLGSNGVPGVELPSAIYRPACSAITIVDPALGAICAKNGDAEKDHGRWYWVQRVDPDDDGMRYLNVIWPGTIWTDSGLNEHGLALVQTAGPGMLGQGPGVACAAAPRLVLERARTVVEAIEVLDELPLSGLGLTFALADAGGATAIVEKVHDRLAVRGGSDGFGWAVNTFQAEAMQEGLLPIPLDGLDESNAVRCEAFLRLAERAPRTREELCDALRTPPIRQTGLGGLWSVHSAVYTPSELSLHVADDGREAAWRRFALDSAPVESGATARARGGTV